jgi:ATP-binding cassette, subfamily B, bacterial MsbA
MLRYYWHVILRHYTRPIGLIALTAFFASMLEAVGIGLIVPLLNLMINSEVNPDDPFIAGLRDFVHIVIPNASPEMMILSILGGIAFLIMVKNSFDLYRVRWVRRLSALISNEYRERMFSAYLRTHLVEVTGRGRGVIVQNLEAVTGSVQNSINATAALIHSIIYICSILALLFYLSWWATIILGSMVMLGVYFIRWLLEKRVQRIGAEQQSVSEGVSKLIVDTIDGLRIIKAQNIESIMDDRLQEQQRPLVGLAGNMGFMSGATLAFFEIYSFLLLIFVVGIMLNFKSLGLGLPELAALTLAMRRLQPSISSLGTLLLNMSESLRKVQIADDVLNKMPQENSGDLLLPGGCANEIELSKVEFSYYKDERDPFVLKVEDLVLRRGEITALIGPTGAGKSTLVDLLMRMYDPTVGQIKVDGLDLPELDLNVWRQHLGYVGQDIYLFNSSIGNNISLWSEVITQEEIEGAAKAARIHDYIISLPEGYDTVVGDRGLKLSGGQRQRVAIARAIARQPNLLIFDEATSALDNLTEQEVQQNIDRLRQNAIVVIIAHRLSTIRYADQIAVVDNGEVVEIGDHEGLMEKKGRYFELNDSRDRRTGTVVAD